MIRRESGLTAVSVLVVLALLLNASFALAAEVAPVLNIVEVTNKGDVSLTFDKEMAEPAEGAEEQFKVTIDEAEVKVTAVEETNTPEKIKLVLEQKVEADQEVTVEYVQGENEELWVKAADGTAVESFEPQTAGVKNKEEEPEASEPKVDITINDIEVHWAQDIIKQLAADDVLIIDEEGNFKPQEDVTRAEFAAMLVKGYRWKNAEIKSFRYSRIGPRIMCCCAGRGHSEGYDNGNFGPEDLITREQIAAMIVRAAKLEGPVEGKEFADADEIADWAQESVQLASVNDILQGLPDNTFLPKANATKAEAAVIVYRALQLRNK